MPGPAVTELLNWKENFLKEKIKYLNDKIAANNARIAHLKTMPDTDQQVESLEHINAGLEVDRNEVEDELARFKAGSDGHKYHMAKRNIDNLIHLLQRIAAESPPVRDAALAAVGPLIDKSNAATEEIKNSH